MIKLYRGKPQLNICHQQQVALVSWHIFFDATLDLYFIGIIHYN